ncbi:hypothetical protein AAVH_29131 [Aphelenchoides avenae]|nr:hypothetical protein AAVH_29131 [Aphelenchus avenae]
MGDYVLIRGKSVVHDEVHGVPLGITRSATSSDLSTNGSGKSVMANEYRLPHRIYRTSLPYACMKDWREFDAYWYDRYRYGLTAGPYRTHGFSDLDSNHYAPHTGDYDYTYRVPKVRQIPLRNSNYGYGYYSYPKTEIKYTFRPYNIYLLDSY